METKQKNFSIKTVTTLFFVVESIIYLAIIINDIYDTNILKINSDIYRYAGICLCFSYIQIISMMRKKYIISILISLVFIMIADYFLIFTKYYFLGVLSFCFVQISYQIYINKFKYLPYSLLISFIVTFIFTKIFKDIINKEAMTAIFYMCLQVFNIISLLLKKDKSYLLLIGILLLFVCDLSVGLSNFDSYFDGVIFEKISNFFGKIIWVFYFPSQIIITQMVNVDD